MSIYSKPDNINLEFASDSRPNSKPLKAKKPPIRRHMVRLLIQKNLCHAKGNS